MGQARALKCRDQVHVHPPHTHRSVNCGTLVTYVSAVLNFHRVSGQTSVIYSIIYTYTPSLYTYIGMQRVHTHNIRY